MTEQDRLLKIAYFQEQDLLHLSEEGESESSSRGGPDTVDCALSESEPKPQSLGKRSSSGGGGGGGSFLGSTPKERQAEWERCVQRQRVVAVRRDDDSNHRPVDYGEPSATKPYTHGRPQKRPRTISPSRNGTKANVTTSSRIAESYEQLPFYRKTGAVPRELKNGKNVKLADNIKLEPNHKQLLRGKFVYFYPNDDISMARRMRIHKAIQLGAAWIIKWRDEVTHVMMDDVSFTYSQLLRHLNKTCLPEHVVLVKFDPYLPQCIQFGVLLDPTAERFLVEGAPKVTQTCHEARRSCLSTAPQSSVQVKSSALSSCGASSLLLDSHTADEGQVSVKHKARQGLTREDDRVADSFAIASPSHWESTEVVATSYSCDPLLQTIQEAKAISHLPLDEDDDMVSLTTTSQDQSEESETDEEPPLAMSELPKTLSIVSRASALRSKHATKQGTFQCMKSNTGDARSDNPNACTIEILTEMCEHYERMQDSWRSLAYRKGIATLRNQKTKISSAKQAAGLPFIGSRLAEKIEEIVLTKQLRRLNATRDDPSHKTLQLFLGIYGVGFVQASKWIQAGYHTLEDVQKSAKLSDNQKVGIEHYHDFNSRISRAEVEAHGATVKAALQSIDEGLEATIMGSYRRGAENSGDIDMIITKPGATIAALRADVFDRLVPQLYEQGFLRASLATSRSSASTSTKWHGASCLPSSATWRRIDFLLVPEGEMGAALLYFTGNDIFNRSIRLLARKKNMRLNQRGLYKDVQRGRGDTEKSEGLLVEGGCEKKIFEILGVPWREPCERVC